MSTVLSSARRVGRFTRHLHPVEWQEAACSLCGSSTAATLLAWHDATQGFDLKIVRCGTCDLVYTNPRPTPDTIGHFYPSDYGCYEVRSAVSRRWTARLRAPLERAVLRVRLGYPPRPVNRLDRFCALVGSVLLASGARRREWIPFRGEGRLLDFGCGAGAFLQRMRGLGWQVEGLDMSAATAHEVRGRRGIHVHVGTLPHRDLSAATFDCVTMWESLEHVHDPRLTVREARRLLRPRGLLVIAVPNLASWSFRRFGQHWFALDVPRHLTHFTPGTLTALLEAEGFRVAQLTYLGTDGWIRQSARRLAASGSHANFLTACRAKPLAQALAAFTERTHQSDDMMVLAERD